jgi:hypothetical protein
VPLDEIDDELPAAPRDADELARLAEAYGVQSPVERLLKAVAAARS